jgi:hypothetical protein
MALMLLAAPASIADEQELEDKPAAISIKDFESPLERSYAAPEIRQSLFPWITSQMQPLPPFLADSKLYLRYRTYYLRQDRTNGQLSAAWAMGGSVYYRSGWLKEFLAVELEGFTSQPIVAPESRDGTRLLKDPGSMGYSVLGVANAKLRYRDLVLTGYRQQLDLPYLNRQDSRMTPNTFEAAKLVKETGPLRFVAGYAWKFKQRNGDDFVSLAEQVGVPKNRGAAFGSVIWYVNENTHVGASGFVVPDILASVYVDGHHDWSVGDDLGIRFDAQFTHQSSVGQELLAGAPFDSWNLGLRTSASWRKAVVRLAFAITGDERRIENFYGSNPTYIGLMQRTFNQADEKALLVSLSYDFSKLGIEGLSAIANFAQGWDGVIAGKRGNAREFNFTADYRIGTGILQSLWLRLRAAWIEDSAAPSDGTDFRVILRYELPVI